jgi:2-deoxy-D-gluconate 3-dehydrogenase
MEHFNVSGKNVIITGGSRGIGKAIARSFLEAGCEVAMIGSSDMIYKSAKEFSESGFDKCHPVRADLSISDQVSHSFALCIEKLNGNLDVIVNNAAVIYRGQPEDISLEHLLRLVETNVIAYYMMTKMATDVMKVRKKGRVINISSTVAHFGGVGIAAYSSTKRAILQLTKSFSNDCSCYGITYNCVAPGYTATDFIAGIDENRMKNKILPRHPVGRIAIPNDISSACIYLASDEADFISGLYLDVNGGYLSMPG